MVQNRRRLAILLGIVAFGMAIQFGPTTLVSVTSAVSSGLCTDDADNAPPFYAWAMSNFPHASGGSPIYGIRADFNPNSEFKRCQPGGGDNDGLGSSSAWVALVNEANGNDIMQIGVNDCNDVTNQAVCPAHAVGTLRYFYAYGWSCASGSQAPVGHDLGPANTARHTYIVKVTPGTSGLVFNMYIDGVLKFSVPLGNKCWVHDPATDANMHFIIAGEVHDHGDGLGSSAARSRFDFVDRQLSPGGAWGNTTMTSCTIPPASNGHTRCSIVAGDIMDIWTQ